MAILTDLVTFEHLPMAGMLLDLEGCVMAVNAAMRALLGATQENLVGKRLDQLVKRGVGELLDSGHHQRSLVDELELQTPLGPRTLEVVMSVVEQGTTQVIQLFGIDVTARKRELATSAKERAESLGIVAGGIAHDFNNLLVGVLAEASSAREDSSLPEGVADSLRRIESAARKMSQLTRSMLAYAGRGGVEAVRMDPDGVIGEMHEQLLRIVTAAKLSLATNAGPVAIEADASLIKQMIANLVANAAEAKGSFVEVETRVVMRGTVPWWQLEVSDDGEGIQPTALAHIFEPFYTTRKDQTGLGLSAVQGIVRRLGGDIEVDSSPGRGARFRVRLPVLAGVEAPARRKTTTEGMTPIAKLSGARVLVADDEPSVRTTVRRLLERRGASVELAIDGSDAEAKLSEGEYKLLIVDVSMPGRTGYDVLATARRVLPNVPVILMSGYTEQARGAGGERPDGFLEKPFTARTLDSLIDQVMREAAGKTR